MSIIGIEAYQAKPPAPESFIKQVPLELFGGLCSEMEPGDLPQGASPFCQDMDFELGATFTRAGLTAVFPPTFLEKYNYLKTTILPNGDRQLLTLASNGKLEFEDTTNNEGTLSLLYNGIIPGTYAHSTNAFGREYIAFNNRAQGADIPRQYDGTFLDRVSQGGPALPPTINDSTNAVSIVASPNGFIPVVSTGVSLIENGNIVTVQIAPPVASFRNNTPLPQVGDVISIPTASVAGYEGSWPLTFVGPTYVQFFNPTSGLGAATGATIEWGIVKISVTPSDAPVSSGGNAVVSGAGNSAYDGSFSVRGTVNSNLIGIPANVYVYNQASLGVAASGGGQMLVGGSITAGVHQFALAFLTRQGYITKPSPISSWTAQGSLSASVTGMLTGPSNIVARIIIMTAAGGGFFFYIPIPTTGSSTGTQINDNVSTTATIDFTDATLLAATSVDQPGNNLFNLEVLGPCLGVETYADRMWWWGELNAIQNFLNMAFDGGWELAAGPSGADVPAGWSATAPGGQRVPMGGAATVWGDAYQIVADGVTVELGTISQSAMTDSFGEPILQNQLVDYSVSCYLRRSPNLEAGVFHIGLVSPSAGVIGTPMSVNTAEAGLGFKVFTADLMLPQGTTLPSDTQLQVWADGTPGPIGEYFVVDEIRTFPTQQPVLTASVRGSYVINPESFDGVTGRLGVEGLGSLPATATFQLRDNFYIAGLRGLFQTADNGTTEPSGWSISTISNEVGCCSVDGVAIGEEWVILANGLRGNFMFSGNEPIKISQEVQPNFDVINSSAVNAIWMVNDVKGRRVMMGVPINGATVPNNVYMMNYQELNASWMVAEQGPIHISYAGKMVSWDMSRKWCPWNIFANCGAVVERADGSEQVFFGSNSTDEGNILMLDPTNLTDNGLAINSIYFPFFFVNRDMEQALQMGLGRKLYTYIRMFVAGAGTLNTTAQSDSLTGPRVKAMPPRTLNSNPGYDTELRVNWTGDRTSFGLQTATAGSWFKLSKMVVSMKQDPHMPIRGRV